MAPSTDDLALKRAAEIHAEKRDTFDFGPPPYAHVMTIDHPATGCAWKLRISRFSTPEAISTLAESLGILTRTGNPESVAAGLAYISAATEITGMEVARAVSE